MTASVVRVTLLLGVACAAPLTAQTPAELLKRGVEAYQRLELQEATDLFARALARADDLDAAAREQALAYLGASFAELGRRGDASRTFRDLLLFAPAHRLDPLRFSAQAVRVFDDVRATTKAVALDAGGGARLTVRLTSSSPHEVTAVVLGPDDRVLRTLFSGQLEDAGTVVWNGRLAGGEPAPPGPYTLVVASQAGPEAVFRHVRTPLVVEHIAPDTMAAPPPLPADSLLPERRPGSSGLLPLLAGLAGGAATVVLPDIAASPDGTGGGRFVVGGVLGIAGVVGFLAARAGEPLPANVAENLRRREARAEEIRRVEEANRRARQDPRIVIHAGTPERREGDWR